MELLPVELRKTLPPLYSQESCPTPIVHVKLFTPDSSFTWYVTEGAEQEERRLAPLRTGDRIRRGVGILSAERNCARARTAGPARRTGPVVQARPD